MWLKSSVIGGPRHSLIKMRIEDLPSLEELQSKLKAKYLLFDLTTNSEKEKQAKIVRLQKDLKSFMRSSGKLLEQDDIDMILTAKSRIMMLGTVTIVPSFYIGVKLGSGRASKFRSLSFSNRFFMRLGVMGGPIFVTYYYSYYLSERLSMYMEDKYAERVQEFRTTNDPKSINHTLSP